MSAPHAHASSRARYLPLAWLTLAALGAACAAPPAPVPEADVARGREVLQEYKQGLVSTLVAALEESGPEEAIAVCRQAAPQIAARHAADGV
ncbi:MAG TPA: hypothetical protein VMT16_00045, partial [Thermoanaerobaculia bacterium]|nr:hypothetical protein [Thermoanaerobaculia bacterium]